MAKTLDVALCGRFFVVFPLARLAADILTAGFASGEGRDKRFDSLECTYLSLEDNAQYHGAKPKYRMTPKPLCICIQSCIIIVRGTFDAVKMKLT